jgi:hypothetical protein
MKHYIAITMTLLAFAQAVVAPVSSAQDKPRTSISVIRYQGNEKQYADFIEILTQRVGKLQEQYANRPEFRYLHDLKVIKTGRPGSFEVFWRGTESLVLLNSSLREDKQNIVVTSDVYLYDLRGQLPRASIELQQKITPGDLQFTKDSYSVILLYALAMDAQRMNRSKSIVVALLNKAAEFSTDIRKQGKKGDIALLIDAVERENKSFKGGTKQ